MILADKIMEERKRNGWSQEELADMLGVSRQSVSKWEGAQSVPDLQRILEMSKLFGVSTDYLLKDEEGTRTEVAGESFELNRRLSMEEANAFLADNEAFSKKIAIGVFLCVLCPVPLLLLLAYSETNLMITIGVAALFALVAAALVFIIPAGIGHSRWSWLKEELFDTEYGVDGMVRERKERFQGTFVTAITTGVVLILVGVITLVLGSMLTGKDAVAVALAGVLLVFVAVSVFLFVRSGIVKDGFSQLLREGDYSRKKEKKILDVVAPVYWLSVTAAFLAWSFIGNAWNISWMIWPVAAIVFAIIATICNSMNNRS